MTRCISCHNPIGSARLAAIPTTKTCVSCSSVERVRGFMTWEHKTAPTFQVVTPRQHAWFQQYDRKRPAASLPMSAKSTSAIVYSAPVESPVGRPSTPPESDMSLVPRARCGHADRPQVGPSGKCVECALAYYEIRAKFAKNRQVAVNASK